MNKGRLHSIETFGAVDGPGIRTIFFLQGCPARCLYCHNPDSWSETGGRDIRVEEVVQRAKRGIPYYGEDGGVTFSGGEPLLQGKFLIDAMKSLKANGIGSALDISGTYFDEYSEEAIKESDWILLDIKHVTDSGFEKITGRKRETFFKVAEAINKYRKPVWIRQVILPGEIDSVEYIEKLNKVIDMITNVHKVDLLPYHNMAENKYEKLGMNYRLKGVKPPSKQSVANLEKHLKPLKHETGGW